jgi:DHA3 family multidrug efflux protein-like MFS transporter
MLYRMTDPSPTSASIENVPPTNGMRTFVGVLINTALANVTTSFLWFALTFWVYLETRSVLATGIIGGSYMLFVAVFGMVFGSIVDRHRKHRVMVFASATTLVAFAFAGGIYTLFPETTLLDIGGPWFWLFTGIILAGSVIENMRNIALSTTVTLLIPEERHAKANGLVGTVQGLAFMVTSVFSGLSVGILGMGWTLVLAIIVTALAFAHVLFLRIPEEKPHVDQKAPLVDIRGAVTAVKLVPGLFALIIFATFNNFIGGVYVALMDPYGLELFPVELWGIVLAVASTGFIIGGLIVAKLGLGRNPIRTLLILVILMGALGAVFTIRESWLLYAVGIWLYMTLIPAVEASEQTVIQKVVPFRTQGRVFGFAQALESAASPITAFLIAPLTEFVIIPYMNDGGGEGAWSWLLGEGEARAIALVFLVAGLALIVIALAALRTRSYRQLSESYSGSKEPIAAAENQAATLEQNPETPRPVEHERRL